MVVVGPGPLGDRASALQSHCVPEGPLLPHPATPVLASHDLRSCTPFKEDSNYLNERYEDTPGRLG